MNRCIVKFSLILLLLVVITTYCLLFIAYPPKPTDKPENRTLIIFLSGFGEQQLQPLLQVPNGGFLKLSKGNGTVGYLQPIFPTLSQPNWYAMMTGQYADQHGVVGDIVYIPEREIVIDLTADKNVDQLKTSATKLLWEEKDFQEKKSKFFIDSCSNVPWLKTKTDCASSSTYPTARAPPTAEAKLVEFEKNVDNALTQLHEGEIGVAIVHTNAIYELSTKHGPTSDTTKKSLLKLDTVLKNLLEKIEKLNYTERLNVIVASDHGLASIEKATHVSLDALVNDGSVLKIVSQGTYSSIWTAKGQRDSVYMKLKNVTGIHVWTKDDIPWDFHFRNNDYIAPIHVVAAKGYYIHYHEGNNLVVFPAILKDIKDPKGCEGYDPTEVEEMRGVFVAQGPGFSVNMPRPILTKDFYDMSRKLFEAPKVPGSPMHMEMEHHH